MVKIPTNSDYINSVKQRVNVANTRPEDRATRRPVTAPSSADVAQITKQPIKPQALDFNQPQSFEPDNSQSTFQQKADILTTLFTLLPTKELKVMVQRASEEQKLMGAA